MATTKTFEKLVEAAADQHGFVRIEDVEPLGINPVYLRKLHQAGRLERRAQGLYRLPAIPPTAEDEYHEAVLQARGEGVIAGDAALALRDLADVNPRWIDVVLPAGQRVRRQHDRRYRFRRRKLTPDQIDQHNGIRVLTPKEAIAEAIDGGIAGGLAEQAIRTALGRELINELAAARLRVRLADRNAKAHD